ncbi:CP31B [Symbiodinium natans]|uniref:CP31B protein n=1 Tax=Symbiodinium natans TaxID=878477 RepID=A0A812I631_9DINO|nr:CP31B [Symbiodinium natans]
MAATPLRPTRRRCAKPLGVSEAPLGRLCVLLVAASVSWPCAPLFAMEGPSSKEPELGRSPESRSVYVGNLPWSTRGKQLGMMFEEVGTVLRSEVEMAKGRSHGWATVTMSSPAEAMKAVEKFDGVTIQGKRKGGGKVKRQIVVNLEKRSLLLSNLPNTTTFNEVKDLFSDVGRPRWINQGLSHKDLSPRHMVVIFYTAEEAQKALSMNEKEMGDWTLNVGHF